MKDCCDICGKTSGDAGRYHPACLRRLFGAPTLPAIDLTHGEVLTKAQEMAGRMSISGVQPKLSMTRQGSHLVPVTTGGQFILKPQTERFPLLPQNENLCMNIAGLMEIETPRHGLFDLRDGSPAYLVRRFDRTPDGKKLRCEDFAQILGEDDKYSGSLERIGKRIRELSDVPGLDIQLFFERVLLNFLLGNGDAHLKNFSMLEAAGGGLRLSPAYDIVCSKVVVSRELDCALTLNGKQNEINMGDFEQFARTLGIHPKVAGGIFERFKRRHALMVGELPRSRLPSDMQDKVLRIMEERHRRIFGRQQAVSG
ncbi:MAG: HipA domain-containing protein [Kiritimatiellae bacterium]|nr:HipA domain-containing protein [Kiritimatiellia bacterium]